MRFQSFFWDFDGTLYDSYGRITRAAQKGMADLGVFCSYESVYVHVKRALGQAWACLAAPRGVTEADFMAAYRRHAEEEADESLRLYPGAREMLLAVHAMGASQYLYTHRGRNTAFRCLERDGIASLFADAVTIEDGFPRKPAPDALESLVKKHGLQKSACVMVGDRDIDFMAAANAGMQSVLFDPEGFYAAVETPLRFDSFDAMRRALTGSA